MSYEQALNKTLEAARAGKPGGISTGEALTAALALNRHDWLQQMGYTIVDALDRIGDWAPYLPRIAHDVECQLESDKHAARAAVETVTFASLASHPETHTDGIDLTAKLITTSDAPGYRDTQFLMELRTPRSTTPIRAWLRVSPKDGQDMACHIQRVHALAWHDSERGPLDKQPAETCRPRWIDPRLWREEV